MSKKINKILPMFLVFSFLLSFMPFRVAANGQNLTVRFDDGQVDGNTIIYNVNNQDVTVTVDGGHVINNGALTIDSDEFLGAFTIDDNFNSETMVVRIYENVENGFQTNLNYSNGVLSRENEGGYPNTFNFVVESKQEQNDEHQYGWDGNTVYFVWATEGETNNFYYHKIANIVGGGDMNYVPVSEIADENNEAIKYDINNRIRSRVLNNEAMGDMQSYEFVWTQALNDIKNDENFTALPTTQKLEFLRERGMTVNPIGALSGANCVSTMGDLGFKLTIYNDAQNAYEAIKVGVPEDYRYYPAFWDANFHWDVVDISSTTEESPAKFEAFLLENTLQLNSANFSRGITSIKALGVPDKAVTISDAGNGKWNITYSSNYYNDVEFEITDTSGQKYYIVLLRVNVRLKNFWTDETRTNYAAIYYPSTDSYTNYSLILTVNYKNGESETKILSTPNRGIEAENGDSFDEYELDGGENLKTAWYKLDGITSGRDSNIYNFYITVVKDYSANSENYGGTLAGAGDGIEFRDTGYGFRRILKGETQYEA